LPFIVRSSLILKSSISHKLMLRNLWFDWLRRFLNDLFFHLFFWAHYYVTYIYN